MATKTWIGNAADVQQITTITVGGTWLSTETATLTVNGKDLTITLVGDEATTVVATALKEAWMSGVRLDGTGTTDATSNVGGQQFGEFAEVTASVSGSVVTLKGNTPGVPFVVSASETSTSGTLTPATPQACTGKEYWSNVDNWDTGTVPVDDDTVVFRDSNVSCRYGLPDGTDLECTINQYQSYTGEIGLPPINNTNVGKPYYEYRQRYVRLDDGGGGSDIAHRFGIGLNGSGSPLINLKHSTVKISPFVFNTGTPLTSRPGTKALNICATANTSTINILGGSVDFSSQDGSTSAWLTATQVAGDSRCIQGIHTSSAVVRMNGGTMVIGGSGAISEINMRGGTLRLENQTGTISTLGIYGGVLDYASAATVSSLGCLGGTFDCRSNVGAFTITAGSIYVPGAKFLDPYGRAVAASNFLMYGDPSPDLQFGGSQTSSIQIVLPS